MGMLDVEYGKMLVFVGRFESYHMNLKGDDFDSVTQRSLRTLVKKELVCIDP